DCFSTEPLGFLETAMKLETEAVETFRFMKEINRHSPVYYQTSSQLEKLVSQLGSACITKAVMEQQGKDVSFLDHLTIDWLRELTAFNFRKCYASFMESMSVIRYNGNALALSTRWAALDKRLLATAEKIELIKAGKLKVSLSDPAEKRKNETNQAAEKQEDKPESVSPMASKGRAFSIDREVVRGMEREDSNKLQENALPVTEQPGSTEETPVEKITDCELSEHPNTENVPTGEATEAGNEDGNVLTDPAVGNSDEELSAAVTPEVGTAEMPGTKIVPDVTNTKRETAVTDEFEEPFSEDPDDWEDIGCEDEEILPYVSEEMVQRMSALWNDPDLMSWAYRQTASNAPP
ncbi:MAG: hypothetical protein IJI14_19205, partial [Anaerolineaceae bacterium]|nr:hypothetical protein [Anaerolineaceae bacterium]